jgi:hypothetical protein
MNIILRALVLVVLAFAGAARAQVPGLIPAITVRGLAPQLAGKKVTVFAVAARAPAISGVGQLPILMRALSLPRTVTFDANGDVELPSLVAPRKGFIVANYLVFVVHDRSPADVFLANPDGKVVGDPRCPNGDCSGVGTELSQNDRLFYLSLERIEELRKAQGEPAVVSIDAAE